MLGMLPKQMLQMMKSTHRLEPLKSGEEAIIRTAKRNSSCNRSSCKSMQAKRLPQQLKKSIKRSLHREVVISSWPPSKSTTIDNNKQASHHSIILKQVSRHLRRASPLNHKLPLPPPQSRTPSVKVSYKSQALLTTTTTAITQLKQKR